MFIMGNFDWSSYAALITAIGSLLAVFFGGLRWLLKIYVTQANHLETIRIKSYEKYLDTLKDSIKNHELRIQQHEIKLDHFDGTIKTVTLQMIDQIKLGEKLIESIKSYSKAHENKERELSQKIDHVEQEIEGFGKVIIKD